jgi:hypothetical protein
MPPRSDSGSGGDFAKFSMDRTLPVFRQRMNWAANAAYFRLPGHPAGGYIETVEN